MDHRWVELARTLRHLGWAWQLAENASGAADREVASGGNPFILRSGQEGISWFLVDGEAMAEGGVVRRLADLAPALRAHGVELRLENVNRPLVDDAEGEYVVAVNDRRCVVWTPEDWAAQRAWEVAVVRPLAVVNDLLAEAGAVPRFFTLHAGANDGIVWLLDARVVAAVAGSGLLPQRETPALATHG